MNQERDDTGGHVKPPKCLVTNSSQDHAVAWKLWIQQWDWYAIATNLEKKRPEIQVAIFMSCIGPEAVVIYNTFNLTESEGKSLEIIKQKYTAYFTPKVNETYERYILNSIVQGDSSFDEFITNLKTKIKNCGYGNLEDTIIRDRVVIGITCEKTREKLLAEEKLTLQRTIDICHSAEQVRKQASEMKQTANVDVVTNWRDKKKTFTKNQPEEFHCGRCDTTHGRRSCPAFRKICKSCNRRNHLTKCCKTKKVEIIEQDSDDNNSNESFFVHSIEDDVDTTDWLQKVYLSGKIAVKFKLDSGSQCNVITRKIADKAGAVIKPCTTRYLTSFSNHKIQVLGEAKLETKIKNINKEVKYMVVDKEVTPIMGKSTCVRMNLMKRIESIEKDNEDLFTGIGCLKEFVYDIDLIDNPNLPICPARKVPHILRKTVKEELDMMVQQNIIIPVTKPTPAVSPMVVVKKGDKIRLCIDPSAINKNLKRRHYPLNTVEEIAARINGSKWFSLLDCRKGFWNLKVTKRTSEYLTFSTPFGRYSCLRMPFGLASAPEVFQQVMTTLLAEFKNVEVSMDDVLIHAENKLELEKITNQVLEKFRRSGLKLNKDKCKFNVQEVKFLGHMVTHEGLKPDPEKINTINKLKKPENVKDLQRFLGLITYLSKFIKNLSDETAPLRLLLQKNVAWCWDIDQENAFLRLKELLQKPPVLGYYETQAPILLSVDASSYACGGVLMQNDKPIAYCAKSFTKTEMGYSQLEKEANAILVACKKFHSYIWGCKDLTIESDHKPLETIFKKPLTEAPPRLQRMFYQILPYNPKIIYKKGKEMYVADTLSRDCIDLTCEEEDSSFQICALAIPFSKTRSEELKKETEKSDELKLLKDRIMKGWPEKICEVEEDIKKYWFYRETLSVHNSIILKNGRPIVPRSMVPLVLKHCHLSHKGIQGTLQLARDNVFWPDMTNDITKYVKNCKACQKIQRDNCMEPIMPQNVPERSWSIVATDLFHLKGKDYIVVADSYSGFFDMQELKDLTSASIITKLKNWFAIFGIPDIVQSDGGKQYDCEEFRKFTKEWKFDHRISSPHYPRSNGLAERYVQEAKTLLKKCMEDNTDIYLALLHHRNTPRLDLGSPCQRLMNKRTKTLLPTNERLLTPKVIRNVTRKLKSIKDKEKTNADLGKKEIKQFEEGENVMLRKNKQDWVPATILQASPERPRSYILQTTDGSTYNRNKWHLKHTSTKDHSNNDTPTVHVENQHQGNITEEHDAPAASTTSLEEIHGPEPPTVQAAPDDASPAPVPTERHTRSGRLVNTPARYR